VAVTVQDPIELKVIIEPDIVQSPAAEKVSDNPELVLAETLYVPGLV
jgi:hypothetical protein